MKLHREGYLIIFISILFLSIIQVGNYILYGWTGLLWLFILLSFGLLVMAYLVIQFFRVPKRKCEFEENDIVCPADGKVVAIEEIKENEYFKDQRIQISIFMSPLNVHANYNPISGIIKYVKYHPGRFLVAWHPKSSVDNERTTIVTEHKNGKELMYRQIAGAVARRICYYVHRTQKVKAGEEFGFIKFGSRVDIILPTESVIDVKIGDKVKSRITKLGSIH